MESLEEQPDPSFASVLEPLQLRRPHCDHCRDALAEFECQRCVQRFCKDCELVIHHRLEKLAMKNEESKGDGRPHQEFLKAVNTCQVCGQNTMDFLCLGCNAAYQCEKCCATKHLQQQPNSGHCFFSIEGSSPSMLKYASWNITFVEMVKMCKGKLQDAEAGATVASNTANDVANMQPDAMGRASAVSIKLEQAATSTNATAAALGNLSIDGTPAEPTSQSTEPPISQAKHYGDGASASVVDLTLDDESDSSSASTPAPFQPRIKEEPRVKTENAWLNAATAASSQPVIDVDELMEKAMGEEEDPVLRSMITEYNDLSAKIFEMDQEAALVREKSKQLSGAQPINMFEVNKSRAMTKKLRNDKTEAERSRNRVVANLVMYLKPDQDELKKFLSTCVADVPSAQEAIHRNCANQEAEIRTQLEGIQKIQRDMEELISMKKDAFAEVTRLGTEIAASEELIRKLDKERLDMFLSISQFSRPVQDAVRKMLSP